MNVLYLIFGPCNTPQIWYTKYSPLLPFFMNKHQSSLQQDQQSLHRELLSDNSALNSIQLLLNWTGRNANDRLTIYENVFRNIDYQILSNENFLTKLQEVLNNVKDPILHCVALNISAYKPIEFLSVLDAVDVHLMDKELKANSLAAILRNQNDHERSTKNMMFLYNNYAAFKSLMRPHKNTAALIAAQIGHTDLLEYLDYQPANPTQKKNFFAACCIGGLLSYLKNLNVSNSETLHDGMLKSLRRGHQHVGEYICSLSCVQWDKVNTFEPLLHTTGDLFNTLLEHYKTHPDYNSLICRATHLCLMRNIGNFAKILSHTPSQGVETLVRIVVASRSKKNLKTLLRHIGDSNFNKGLEGLESKHIQWAQNYRAQLQQRMLKKEVKSAPTVVRKSKM